MAQTDVAFPYQRLTDDSISVGPWLLEKDGSDVPLEGFIEHWDYDTDLILRREVSFDPLRIYAETRLREDAEMRLIVLLTTGRGSLRTMPYSNVINHKTPTPFYIEIKVQGTDVQGDLKLDSQVVLGRTGSKPLALGASQTGSRLWGDSFTTAIEGARGRLPIAVVDLQMVNSAYAMAPWYVEWSGSNLDANFLGAAQLLLNSRRKDIVSALDAGDRTIIGLAASDMARQILSTLVSDQDSGFSGEPKDYAEHSLGAIASEWFRLCFSDRSVEEVRLFRSVDPAGFEASVQSGFSFQDV